MTVVLAAEEGSDSIGRNATIVNKPPQPISTLFVWDFDWTVINCNSDEYIPASFIGSDEMERRLRAMIKQHGPEKWHDCVADLINDCMTESKATKQDVLNVAASMPYLVDIRGALEDIANNDKCGQAIISDGNDEFIKSFLKRNDMGSYFSRGIETNFGIWDNNKDDDNDNTTMAKEIFSVVHQSTKYGGHSCAKCPPNLCKTQVLLDVLSRETQRPRVVYIGDGSNDVCPAINVLEEGDVLLARRGNKISNPNALSGEQQDKSSSFSGQEFPIMATIERRQREDGLAPRCRVSTWNLGKELRDLVQSILNSDV